MWWRAAASALSGIRHVGLIPLVLLLLLFAYGVPRGWGDIAGAPPSKSNPANCNRPAFRVVLDVGHTLEAPGALSARGIPEYDFNLRLARQIEDKLIAAGFGSTLLLITGGPAKRSLIRRVARANLMRADLFVSIHHDSVPKLFKEEWEYDGQKNRFCDRFKGHSIFISHDSRRRNASISFARQLGHQLKARGLHYTPHYTQAFMGRWQRELLDAETGVYRYDELIVLRTTQMPAVLLEAGSIVNRDEELLLASAEHQLSIAAGVVDAVEGFCSSRHVPKARISTLHLGAPKR